MYVDVTRRHITTTDSDSPIIIRVRWRNKNKKKSISSSSPTKIFYHTTFTCLLRLVTLINNFICLLDMYSTRNPCPSTKSIAYSDSTLCFIRSRLRKFYPGYFYGSSKFIWIDLHHFSSLFFSSRVFMNNQERMNIKMLVLILDRLKKKKILTMMIMMNHKLVLFVLKMVQVLLLSFFHLN